MAEYLAKQERRRAKRESKIITVEIKSGAVKAVLNTYGATLMALHVNSQDVVLGYDDI